MASPAKNPKNTHKKKIEYQFSASPAGYFSEIKAKIYGPILVTIAEQKGELHPVDVVEAARNEESPLHREFTWDNDKAADAYRLVQARKIIQGIIITAVIRPRKDLVEIRLFHSTKNRDGVRSYGLVNILNRDEFARQQIEAQALKALIYWQERLKVYKTLPEVVAALEGLRLEEQLVEVEKQKAEKVEKQKKPQAHAGERMLLPARAGVGN